jgi:hypothetical protein
MAYAIAGANGNFTAAATWQTCNGTFFLDSMANSTAIGTSWVGPSSGQTPGAITVDGLAVKVHSRVASPAGTFSVRLYNITDAGAAAGTTVTINVSDLYATQDANANGWVFFKFAAPVLLIAAKSYRPEAICSVASEVTLYRDGTSSNWSRLLRTTTTGALAAGDAWFILGEWTAAATQTARTVTMDQTATTDYGNGTESVPEQFGIGKGGTLTWGTAASTNYRLRLSGICTIYEGGTMTIGTVATPVPRTSTAELQFDVVTTNQAFGLRVYGTFVAQGLSRTSGKDVWQCNLTADTLAGSPNWAVNADTGWWSGDVVAISGTRRTANETERLVLNGAAGASSFATTANAAATHDGTGNVKAKVVLITRNVVITNVTTTKYSFGVAGLGNGAMDCDWVLFQRAAGTQTTSDLKSSGVEGSVVASYHYCFMGDCDMAAVSGGTQLCLGVAFVGTLTVEHCALGVNNGSSSASSTIAVRANTLAASATVTVDDLVIIGGNRTGGAMSGITFTQDYGSWTNIEIWHTNSGAIDLTLNNTAYAPLAASWVLTNVSCFSCSVVSSGLVNQDQAQRVEVGVINFYRCFSSPAFYAARGPLVVNGGTHIGNSLAIVALTNGIPVTLRNILAKCETGYTSQYAISTIAAGLGLRLENCEIGGVGANENYTNADFTLSSAVYSGGTMTMVNCKCHGATRFNAAALAAYGTKLTLQYQREQQVTGVHFTEYPDRGYVRYETTTFRTAAPSERLQLGGSLYSWATAGDPLKSSPRRVGVRAGYRAEVSVWVRKDGTYAGAQPRLRYGANAAIGVDTEGTLDTLSVGADEWEQLTGIVPSAVAEEDGVVTVWVEADGAAGNVYVDDWTTVEA